MKRLWVTGLFVVVASLTAHSQDLGKQQRDSWINFNSEVTVHGRVQLNANRDNFIKGIKGILVSSNFSTFDGYQSLEFTAETNDTIYKSRVFIVGRRPYQLITGTLKGVGRFHKHHALL
jgi:hypothetical protein